MQVYCVTIVLLGGEFIPYTASSEEEAFRIVDEAKVVFEDDIESLTVTVGSIDCSPLKLVEQLNTLH